MIEVTRGDSAILEWQITEAYDANGQRLTTLSGITFTSQARWSPDDSQVLFSKSTADGSIIVDGMTVLVRLSPSDTAGMPAPCVFVMDLQAQAGGTVSTVHTPYGQPLPVHVRPDVTR